MVSSLLSVYRNVVSAPFELAGVIISARWFASTDRYVFVRVGAGVAKSALNYVWAVGENPLSIFGPGACGVLVLTTGISR